jgi:hypothetical protein
MQIPDAPHTKGQEESNGSDPSERMVSAQLVARSGSHCDPGEFVSLAPYLYRRYRIIDFFLLAVPQLASESMALVVWFALAHVLFPFVGVERRTAHAFQNWGSCILRTCSIAGNLLREPALRIYVSP